jgi:DNA-directed RNA polymerase subunit H (RpoH/RPB5)
MMEDRGYNLVERNRNLTHKTTVDIWESEKKNVLVIQQISDNIQNVDISEIITAVKNFNENVKSIIKLYRKSVTFCVKNKTMDIPYRVEFINIKDLMFDIISHSLQPNFKRCNASLREIIIRKHLYNMPQILSTDPVVRWYDWTPGDIIAICSDKQCNHAHTKNGIACKEPRFRRVINNVI